MAISQQKYLKSIEKALDLCLCLRNYPSELVERHNKPEIEVHDYD